MKKVLLGLLSVFALVVIAACGTEDPIEVESVTLSEGDLQLEVGETLTVTATVEPEEADNLEVRWTTNNSQVAVVSDGEIQALRPGSATITATSRANEDISAALTVTVLAAPMSVSDVLAADEDDEVNTIGVVTAITNHATFFIADDSGAISVYDGDAVIIDDISVGDEVRIWGLRDAFNGLLQVGSLTQAEVLSEGNDLPDSVDIDHIDIEDNAAMLPFQSQRVNLEGYLVDDVRTDTHGNVIVDLFSPFTEKEITIRYDDRLGHDDDKAELAALVEGDFIDITGMTLGWFHGPQLLFTSADEFADSSASLDRALEVEVDEVEVKIGEDFQIEWAVQPIVYFDQDVTFESSDEDVATVDENGVVTGVKSGSATITVTVQDDTSLTADITVTVPALEIFVDDAPKSDEFTGGEPEYTVRISNTATFDISYLIGYAADDDASLYDQTVTVVSLNTSLVTVTEDDGVFTLTADAENTGQTIVQIQSTFDPATTTRIFVEVTLQEPEISLPPEIQILYENDTFDVFDNVTAYDDVDGDLTADIVLVDDGGFELGVPGTYVITFSVTNSFGATVERSRTVQVMEEGQAAVSYATGKYNFQFVDSDLKHLLFAYAERYLVQNVYGGLPMNANAGYAMYSPRLEFPVDEYVPIMGYGLGFGSFDADDSTVSMEDGSPGNVGEYTFRNAMTSNPDTFDQWNYQDSVSADVGTLFLDSLYYFAFNEDKTGFEVLPSMATEMPRPFDDDGNALVDENFDPTPEGQAVIDESGRILASTWTVSIQEDLMWTFHEDTDTTGFDHDLNAHDFIDTYRTALEEGWFRAISGGGDFTSAPQEIVNAQAFADGDVDFEEVGLTALDDYTLEFVFVGQMDEWNVIYWLSSFVMSPIHMGLYDAVGAQYGTDEKTTAYHGPYMLTYYEPDQITRLEKNPNFHDPERHFYTGYTFRVIEDAEIRFQEFLAGTLESVAVPGTEFETYQDDPRLRSIPGATTFRMAINSLGTLEAQRELFPGSNFRPEPLLAWENENGETMRQALYFAVNRDVIANEVNITSEAIMFYFSSAYMVDPASGVSFREWDYQKGLEYQIEQDIEAGLVADEDEWMTTLFEEDYPYTWVGRGMSPSTNGFNPDLAKAIFEDIIDEMVEAGIYGENDIIELDLGLQSGSPAQMAMAEYLKEQWETLFVHEDHNISIRLAIVTNQFPDNYFLRSIIGVGDLNMGGISGGTLDASSFLRQFTEDNKGGFTLDWGIDTTSPNILITYTNMDGEEVEEMWSFNALVNALNGDAYVLGGVESTEAAVFPDGDPDSE